MRSRDFLTFYAEHFRTVEVDSTFYARPSVRTVSNWAARTPEGWWIESLRRAHDPHVYLQAARPPAKQVCYLQPQCIDRSHSDSMRNNRSARRRFGHWPMAREKQMVAELKRLKLRKINMGQDAKGDSRAGKPPPLSSLGSVVVRSLGRLERTLLFLCTLQTQEQFPRGPVPMRF